MTDRVTSPSPAPFVIAFALAAGLSTAALILCGASLALFLGGFFFLSVLLPPLILTQDLLKWRLFMAGCVADGIASIWLIAAISPEITFYQWLRCYVVLIAIAACLSGLVIGLNSLRVAPIASSAITVILGLGWLTWPVWMSPYLAGPSADWIASSLIRVHPLFAVNGVLSHLGAWSHWPIAYRELTTLGQDIPYALPTSIWPATIVHAVIGAALGSLSLRRKTSSGGSSENQDAS